jgi:outer membrane protein assembly factor BamB
MNSGAPVLYVLNAVAQHDGLYLAFDFFSDAMSNALGFPGIDRINLDGARVWHGGGGRDAGRGNWLAVTSGLVVRNDDGLDVYDAANGNHHPQVAFHGSDSWGQVVPTADRLYLVNTDSNDGPPLHVGAFSLEGNPIWLRNTGGVPPCSEQKWPPPGQYCPTKGIASDLANAIAINANVVFFAGDYHVNSQISQALTSGYYAFDAAAGNQRWFSAGSPTSALSAGNQMVYGIDSGATLFARRATDGSVVWSKAVGGAGRQAPVLAKDLVVVGGAAGVMAFDATTGNAAWVAQLPGAAVPKSTFNAGNGHYGNETVWTAAFVDEQRGKIAPTTTMAAALASSTLVVTAADGIHVLGLADGREQWRGVPDQAQGRLREPIVMGNRVYVIDTPSDAGQAGLIALEGSGAP